VEDIQTEAFVLRTRAYGESDVIAVLLTADHGKLAGIARGARRSKKRFAGPALEPFQQLTVRFARRPHADLAFLHECRIVRSHHGIAADLPTFAWASYLCELSEVMTPERDPCPELFAAFESTIALLAASVSEPTGARPDVIAHRFIIGLLDWAGWGPDFDVCGRCSADMEPALRPIVDPRGSGLMCARHEAESAGHDPDDPAYQPSRRVVDTHLLQYVRALRGDRGEPSGTDAATSDGGDEGSEGVDADAVREVADVPELDELGATATALLHRLVDLHVGRALRSRRFLAEVTRP